MNLAALFLRDAVLLLPELTLAAGILALVAGGVFLPAARAHWAGWVAMAVLVIVLALVLLLPAASFQIFHGSFAIDGFGKVMKAIALIGCLAAMVAGFALRREEGMTSFEFYVLLLMAALGMMIMISANDLMALYLGLEMQSLPLYALAAFRRDSQRASEAGVKYFVLGALASGLLLYGCSLIYGFAGTLSFAELAALETWPLGARAGLVLVLVGLAFKLSAVPFHMWTPDVYEGAPTPITFFFAVAPKIAAFALLARLVFEAAPGLVADWQQILIILSAASMSFAALAAIGQSNLKRLLAYSSIGHMGYALMGLAAASEAGLAASILYLAIYVPTAAGCFVCLLRFRRNEVVCESIPELAGLARQRAPIAFVFSALMFSLAGIPPLAGFFAKLYIFFAVIEAGLLWLALVGVVASLVAAYYYLRIVKLIYFDEPPAQPLEDAPAPALRAMTLLAGGFVLLFILAPSLLIMPAQWAAASLLGQ